MVDIESACVRNMVKEIVRECAIKKIQVHKNFATFVTNLLLIDPNWGISNDFFYERQIVQNFVKHVIEDLFYKQDSPKVVTLKIQYYCSCNLLHLHKIVEMNRDILKKKLKVLYNDIISCRKLETKQNVDSFYKKMAFYMTLATGLGNPTKPRVYAEALAALKSILKEDQLMEFIKLSKDIKREKIQNFKSLIAGIRLYNRDIDQGGAGIANLPDLLHKATTVIKTGIKDTLTLIKEKENLLVNILSKSYAMTKNTKGYEMKLKLKAINHFKEENEEDMKKKIDYFKDLLVFFKQYELCVKGILIEVDAIYGDLEKLFADMDKWLIVTHEAIYKKVAIPIEIVFPLFIQLWSIWEQFQNKAILLKRITYLMANLEIYAAQTGYQNLNLKVIHQHENCSKKSTSTSLYPVHSKISLITASDFKKIKDPKIEYLGYCCWKLLQTDGALIPGDLTMGLAEFNNKYFVFSCIEAYEEFCKDPEMHINGVLEFVRKQPHFIHLFHLKHELQQVHDIKKLVESKVDVILRADKSIQTEDHIIESHFDLSYRWNVWDLRREALTMAKMCNWRTLATQSNKTSSKNNVKTQTYSTEKQVACQTYKNASVNASKPTVFIYGLRDRRPNRQQRFINNN